MSIFIHKDSRVVVQGVTGKEGAFWAKHMKDMGTQVVFGVTPGKEGQDVDGIPVYHSVRRGIKDHPADVAMLFVPPKFTKDAVFEALDAGIKKICTIADGIPLHEAIQIRRAALSCGAMVVGGNTSGIISVGEAMLGTIPYWIDRVYKKGHVGVMTRSGSLTNEVTAEIVKGGFGVTTLIGVGGDPVPGTRFAELLPLYEADPDTHAVVIIGELGGTMEEEVAEAMEVTDYITFTTSPMQVRFRNGSRIIFKGMDKPAKLKSLNGVSIVWIEECSEVKYAGFKEILGRLRHPTLSNHIILSTNPVSKSNWVYKYFFQDKAAGYKVLDDEELYQNRIMVVGNTYYHHSTVDDNYFVPADYIEQLDELQQHDPDLYRVARKGRFGINGRLVFPQFEVRTEREIAECMKGITNPIEKNGMDFGFVTSYNAVVRMMIDHDNKILYLYDEYYSRDKTDPEIARDIEKWKGILIKADCAEPKAIRYYKQQGFRMKPCKKFQGSREVYTKKVKRFRSIVCSDRCQNIINELKELTFAVDKDGEIIEDEFNIDPHTLSAIWYGLDDYEVSDLKGGSISVLK